MRILSLIVVLAMSLSQRPAWPKSPPADWSVCRAADFEVWCSAGDAEKIMADCRAVREQVAAMWLGADESVWDRPCVVVVHPTLSNYLAAAGRDAGGTLGSTLVAVEQGRVTSRRIDLRGDRPDWREATLPHEMTHAVLAERFAAGPLPVWADEGVATLADPADKQRRHATDFDRALRRGQGGRLAELLQDACPRDVAQRQVFYGQSVSLVRYLVERSSAPVFLQFVERGRAIGYDAALREIYCIDGVAQLERQWLASLGSISPRTRGDLVRWSREVE